MYRADSSFLHNLIRFVPKCATEIDEFKGFGVLIIHYILRLEISTFKWCGTYA